MMSPTTLGSKTRRVKFSGSIRHGFLGRLARKELARLQVEARAPERQVLDGLSARAIPRRFAKNNYQPVAKPDLLARLLGDLHGKIKPSRAAVRAA
jgi:hypothetical protein